LAQFEGLKYPIGVMADETAFQLKEYLSKIPGIGANLSSGIFDDGRSRVKFAIDIQHMSCQLYLRSGTGSTVLSGADSSALQIGQDQVTVKIPCARTGSGRSTRPCSVHFAVGNPLRPKLCSSSIMKHTEDEPHHNRDCFTSWRAEAQARRNFFVSSV
jgi:hypothetical protein